MGHFLASDWLAPDPMKISAVKEIPEPKNVNECETFRQYLIGKEAINVESDHKPLEVIFHRSLLAAPR